MKTTKSRLAKLFGTRFTILLLTVPAFCQPGPPPFPPIQLDRWILAQPNWSDIYGDAPLGYIDLNTAPGWSHEGTALSVDTNCPAFLNLPAIDDGEANINLPSGTIMFWFQPNYTSVPDGGNGPTNWASLLTIGQWTANASASCWSLVIDPDGTNLAFLAQSNGASQIVLTAPIDFDAGDWHSICLTYSSDGCWLYLEGQPVTNAGPIAYTPSDSDCVEYGLSVGSEGGTNGVFQARAQFQDLATYDDPLSADEIAQDYADTAAIILNWGGSLPNSPNSGGFHPANGAPGLPGDGGSGTGGSGSSGGYSLPNYVITSNYLDYSNFWLAVTNNPSNATVSIMSTLPGLTYEILTNEDLASTNWGVWQASLLASNSITWAPPISLNSNTLFFKGVLLGYLGSNPYYPGPNSSGAPSIITQPVSQIVEQGSSATFTVVAVGATPLFCQWEFDGTNIAGAMGSSYTIPNVQATNIGWYVAVVSNSFGTVTSAVATLTTSNAPPHIITQPASQTVNDGSSATFSVWAIGPSPLNYQWRFSGTNNISEATNISGATNSSFAISDVQSNYAGKYDVVVTNAFGSVTSVVATLSNLLTAPVFVFQPISQTVVEGDTVTFSARAAGTEPIFYHWQEYDSTYGYTNLPGQTNMRFVDANMQSGDAGAYAVAVSNAVGTNVFTNIVLTDAGGLYWSVMPIFGPRQDYTFQAGMTYYISLSNIYSGCTNLDFYGVTTIQGAAVLKFDYDDASTAATLVLHGPLVCQTGPYNPAILTSVDDDSQGEPPWLWFVEEGAISTTFPTTAANGYAYLNLDDVHDANSTAISYLRFCYADQAVTTPTNSGVLDVWNCQFVQCDSALNSWAQNKPSTNRVHNALFSLCDTVFTAQTNLAELDGEQVTADVSSLWNPLLAPGRVCLTNSIVLCDLGEGPAIQTQDVSVNPSSTQFQEGDSGYYYLARNSACRGAGTTNISDILLQELHRKTTEAPMSMSGPSGVSNILNFTATSNPIGLEVQEMTFFPAAQRYSEGPPDLGFYYDVLDYTVSDISVSNQVTVLPGTAIGFRNDYLGGFFLQNGSAFVAQGMPTNPIILADIEFVQEGPLLPGFVYQPNATPVYPWEYLWPFYSYGGIDFLCPQADTNNAITAPSLNLRFCNMYLNPDDYLVWAGSVAPGSAMGYSWASSVYWSMRDCNQQGGQIVLGQPLDWTQPDATNYASGRVSWTNNLFDTVGIYLDPSYRSDDGSGNTGVTNLDLPFEADNNLFKNGYLTLLPIPTSAGDWILQNNLFDNCGIAQDTNTSQPLTEEHNAYWAIQPNPPSPFLLSSWLSSWENFSSYPYPVATEYGLSDNDGSTNQTGDVTLTNPPPYQLGPFGNYYMTPGTVLATNGSTSATNLGLYYYTTATNQTIQGDSRVDIGLHYVAASSNASGWVPLETNGIPDYVADVNGNGIIPPGAANPDSAFYTNIDLDGDGMVGSVETALDKNPLVFDNPLILTQKVTGQEPAVVTLEVGVSHNLVQSIGQLVLMVDGVPAATNQSTQVADDGNCLLVWNTTASTNFPPGQTYFLQAHLILTNSVTNAGVTADGPLIAFNQPIVIIQPPDQTNGLGGTVTFTASATGPGIYTYQWQFDGTNIAGATNSTYTISNLAMTNAGSYTVVVENADGNPVTSSNAVLTVEDIQLAITSQPLSQQVMEADTVTLAVSAIGTPSPTYQWQMWDSTITQTWTNLPDATNSTLIMLNFQSGDAGSYSVIVSKGTTNLSSLPAILTDLGPSPDGTTMSLVGPRQDYTFRGDTTYFIGSPLFDASTVDLYGNTIIEGRTVIKFYNATNASLIVHGTVNCKTGPYQPAILTSVDDFSLGEQPQVWYPDGSGYEDIIPLGTGTPVCSQNHTAYLNLDDAHDTGGTTLSYLRFSYADQAATTPTNSGNLQVWDCQFYNCNFCLNSRLQSGCSTNGLHNDLFSLCNFALAAQNSCMEVDGEQLTADVVSFCDPEFAPSKVCLTNSIIVGDLGGGSALLMQNVAINPSTTSFGPSEDGSYYLEDGSPWRGVGTSNISATMLQQLRNKTTWAPVSIPYASMFSSPTILSPTVPRYTSGSPDMGYYYDPFDYTVAALLVSSQVTVLPGTAIGIRNDYLGGLYIAGGASLISEGSPTNLITYADVALVQEGPFAYGTAYDWMVWWSLGLYGGAAPDPNVYGGIAFFVPTSTDSSSATLKMDFCQLFMTPDDSCIQAGITPDYQFAWAASSSIYWTMRDSTVQGGYINLGQPADGQDPNASYPGGAVSWANNLFQYVQINLSPSFTASDGDTNGPNVDMEVQAWNNLFRQGSLGLEPITNSTGSNWMFKDNLFDQEIVFQDASQPLDYGYNAYWPLPATALPVQNSMILPVLPWWQIQSPPASELSSTTTGDGTTDGTGEQTNAAPPIYETGAFGMFYQASNSSLLHHGSQTAAAAGLYAYTVLANGAEEANSTVSIGLHYVATNGTGMPYSDTNGLPVWWEIGYLGALGMNATNADPAGDGYSNLEKYLLGLDPNIAYQDPMIVESPADQVAYVGDSTAFTVLAGGTLPLSYQWFDNFNPIAGATNASLVFASVQLTNKGIYSVTVTSVNGSAPSDPALLMVIDPTTYTNSSPVFLSLQDNTTVSGTISVDASFTSIFPIAQAELFIDQRDMGIITNGQAVSEWTVDTSQFPNGTNVVQLTYVAWLPTTDQDTGEPTIGPVPFSAYLTNLVTANALAENVSPRSGFTAGLPAMNFAFDTLAPAVLTLSMYDSTGTNLLWNTSGTNLTAGTWSTNWNMLDTNGNPVPMPGPDQATNFLAVVTSYSLPDATPDIPLLGNGSTHPVPMGEGGTTVDIPIWVSGDPYAGQTAVLFNQYYTGYLFGSLNTLMNQIANDVMGDVLNAYTIHPQDWDGGDRSMLVTAEPYEFSSGDNGNSGSFLWNCFTNLPERWETGDYEYVCHASSTDFGGGTGQYFKYLFNYSDIGKALGNFPNAGQYHHRVWCAEINGCNSATGDMNVYFGSPADLMSRQMTLSSFVGWNSYLLLTPSEWWLPTDFPTFAIDDGWRSIWIEQGMSTDITLAEACSMTINNCFSTSTAQLYWSDAWQQQGGALDQTWWKNMEQE